MTVPPRGFADQDERAWVLFAHLGGIALSFLAPLIALRAKGRESPTVVRHATAALNFQITWFIALIVSIIARVCSFDLLYFLPLLVWLVIVVFSVIGGLRANEGKVFSYPFALKLVT